MYNNHCQGEHYLNSAENVIFGRGECQKRFSADRYYYYICTYVL